MLVSIKGPPQVWLQHQVGLQESVCRPLHASLLGIVQGCLSFTRAFVGMIRGGLCIICLSRLPPGALKDWTLLSRVQNVGLFSLAVAFDSRTARITGVRVWRQKNLSLICPCHFPKASPIALPIAEARASMNACALEAAISRTPSPIDSACYSKTIPNYSSSKSISLFSSNVLRAFFASFLD